MRDIIKLGAFLLVISGVAGLGVGYVFSLTNPLIEKQILQNKINSFKEVYPQADKVENETASYLRESHDPAVKEVNIAYRDGSPVGVIYAVETKGYSGPISILAGFDIAAAKITAIKVLNQSETPGLGAKAKDKFFQDRYRDKNAAAPLEVTKTAPVKEIQIQAITASTITSRAVTKGVNAAREHFAANFARSK
ncbi:MAG: RnfABCDGE type electron transport complex subunit G [Geobacteraceae bacterium]|nr:RnfABCDGE type electron transport complex subunit G [Geobacteraceae bacterium]